VTTTCRNRSLTNAWRVFRCTLHLLLDAKFALATSGAHVLADGAHGRLGGTQFHHSLSDERYQTTMIGGPRPLPSTPSLGKLRGSPRFRLIADIWMGQVNACCRKRAVTVNSDDTGTRRVGVASMRATHAIQFPRIGDHSFRRAQAPVLDRRPATIGAMPRRALRQYFHRKADEILEKGAKQPRRRRHG